MTIKTNLYYVGMDVHKETIALSVFNGSNIPEFEKTIPNETQKIKDFFIKLKKNRKIISCYEAGFCGFSIKRILEEINVPCIVASPGLIPKKPGLRIKTDRRDARSLAKNLKNDELTPVFTPTIEDESVRDYIRMYDNFRKDLKKVKQRLLHFFHRYNKKYIGTGNWTIKHRSWIKKLEFENPILNEICMEYYYQIEDLEGKLSKIKEKIEILAQKKEYKEKVEKLKCFKGIETLIALSFVTEIGDFRRFMKADEFMAFLGLIPSEHSSGKKQNKGGITKTGNSHLRKLLVEAAWHYRNYNPGSKRLLNRRKNQPREVVAYADKAGRRLSKKFYRLIFKNKKSQLAVTAVARELSGFIWGMMTNNIN